MAQRAKRACATPGCPNLSDRGRCEACRPKGERRPNSHQRGYDWQWAKFRKGYLARNPLCIRCDERGRTKPATDVHHKIKLSQRPDLKYDESNLEPLCHECHSALTARGG